MTVLTDAETGDLINGLRNNVPEATEDVWRIYFPRLVRLARHRMKGARYASADEEDLALSAINSLCIGLRDGNYAEVIDQQSLWSLLVSIIGHKCVDLARRENRQKRGGTGTEECGTATRSTTTLELDGLPEEQVSPEASALMTEQMESFVLKLNESDDPDLLVIAVTKMLGDSTQDVAGQLGCVRRTVERKIRFIRGIWEDEFAAACA